MDYLNSLNIHALRQIARHYGIYSPTTKVKPELISGICDVLFGRILPTLQSKKGAPVKEHLEYSHVIDKIDSYFKPYQSVQTEENSLSVRQASSELVYNGAVFSGLLVFGEEEDYLRSKQQQELPFSAELKERYNLKEGDWISVKIRDKDDYSEYEILSINSMLVTSSRNRLAFEQIDSFYPDSKFRLPADDFFFRCVDLFAPIGRGQRVLVSCLSRTDRLMLVKRFLDAFDPNGIMPLVLAVGISSEDEFELKSNERCELFTTRFDVSPETSAMEMRLCAERAKRLCEERKDVLLILYSLYGASQSSDALARTLFSLAKNGKTNGSITVIAFASEWENVAVWQEVSNCVLTLSGDGLEVDPLRSETKRAELLQTKEASQLRISLCRELEKGNSKRFRAWSKAKTTQLFLEKEEKNAEN